MFQTENLGNQNNEGISQSGYVTIQSGSQKQTLEVPEFLTIGRKEDCSIPLDDGFVSKRHARIERTPKGFLLRDLRSRNGTFLNGTRVVEAILSDNDTIIIGRTEIKFTYTPENAERNFFWRSQNEAWQTQLDRLPSIASTELPVLVLGESGTGKEILAQEIHRKSSRSYGKMVSVNCGALGESLIESELFGHLRGSFTGASADRKGAFEAARGGTLFLDEIGELPINLQPKLLRALENNEIRPVGSDNTIKTNVRVIAATHQNLKQKVAEGTFRADLYFRLNVVQIVAPSLRYRMEDFETLLYRFCKEYRVGFSHGAIQTLRHHSWPGNIRELKNSIARAKALFGHQRIEDYDVPVLIDMIPSTKFQGPTQMRSPQTLKEHEKELIIQTLSKHRGNQRKAAAELGMAKSTFHDRVKSYEINVRSLS